MRDADQQVRRLAMSTAKAHGLSSAEYQGVRERGLRLDEAHAMRLEEIIEEHGWPGRGLVGESASKGAFLVLQHAGSAMRRKYVPLVREATRLGDLAPTLLPLLEDRLLMEADRPQLYGTQIIRGASGDAELRPVDDPARVDQRRAAVGLEPLDEYLGRFGIER